MPAGVLEDGNDRSLFSYLRKVFLIWKRPECETFQVINYATLERGRNSYMRLPESRISDEFWI